MTDTQVTEGHGLPGGLVFLGLAFYYLFQALARIATGGGLQLDEAEQVLYSQEWHWGYGSQGPLYTWLILALRSVVPSDLVTLAILKNGLLFLIHVLVYAVARSVLRQRGQALAVSASLLLMPHLVYESQRDQTHLVLATALAAATVAQFLQLRTSSSAIRYALLGAIAALGGLSKYNFVVVLAALAWAARRLPETRGLLMKRQALWAVASFLLVAGPHLAWMIGHPDLVLSQSHKLGTHVQAVDGPWEARWNGLVRFASRSATFLVIPAVFWILLPRWGAARAQTNAVLGDPNASTAHRLVVGTLLATLGLSALAVVLFGVTQMKARWLQPAMILLPVAVAYHFRHRLTPPGQRRLLIGAATSAVVAAAVIHGSVWGARWLERPHNVNARFDAVAQQLLQEGFSEGIIVATDLRIAGNLLRHLPDCTARVPSLGFFSLPSNVATVLVWDASHGPALPWVLREFADRWVDDWPSHQPSGLLEATGARNDPRVTRLYYLLVPEEEVLKSHAKAKPTPPPSAIRRILEARKHRIDDASG